MPPADARNLTQDATASINANAFDYMQAGSVVAIAYNNMDVLSTEQLSSITNSEVYSMLPSSVQSSLNTEIDSTGSTTSTKSSSGKPGFSWFTMLALTLSTIVAIGFSTATD